MYRRAGYRYPTDIGNAQVDAASLKILNHMSAGGNLDYNVTTAQAPGATSSTLTANQFNSREVELWPLVGPFLGSYSTFTEIDASPNSAAARGTPTPPNVTTPASGGVNLSNASLQYTRGTEQLFYSLRGGLISPQGYGASDQWIDDGNIPLFDQLSAQLNQDTLALPYGAMANARLGIEAGLNYDESHLTFGFYNGFDGTNGLANNIQSTLAPALTHPEAKGAKDFKVQLDQFLSETAALTAAFYTGAISLLDPTNVVPWLNRYQSWRLYATYTALPRRVDLLGGLAYGTFQTVDPGTTNQAGDFHNRGAFLGANYYALRRLTLSGRWDFYQHNYVPSSSLRTTGYTLMASVPFENSMVVFHYIGTFSDVSGLGNDIRAEWRFLF
jgi:hypothetical protein